MEIVSTYRLQFYKGFTFRDAAAIVPYLDDLGITHIYASPYLKAVAGSTHGYDVIDHNQLNPEIGTPEDYRYFVETLSRHGMSHILDTVPNHMGVETNENQWWNDVLAHGTGSQYANYFDIDWNGFPSRQELIDKLLMPVLGETYAEALAGGHLGLQWNNDEPSIYYHDRRFPVDPASNTSQPLNDLLEEQHYRLSYWRVAADEINYRRFFDISGLAALQMHRQEVFEAAHAFTFRLIAEGSVAGLRVDHPDGLLDPKEYFDRLQAKRVTAKPLYVSVEKILNGDEALCDDWAVAGTSGYDFLCAINDLFVNSTNEISITEVYANYVGDETSYADWVYRSKCAVIDTAMYSEMASLTNRLDALAQSELSSRDFTRRQLHAGLREVIACFPVYRSYVSSRGVSESDVAVVNRAIEEAARRNLNHDSAVLNFIRDSVLLRYPVAESSRSRQLDFAQRFQQLTSPVNAKGIEDCTFYIYNRLASLNEVGGDPGRFGRDCDAVHRYLSDRQVHWPLALSALSTHDTKRSEDVRARISVLSEIPAEWADRLACWKILNAELAQAVHPNDQYLLYQTLLGAWPIAAMDEAERSGFVARISAYMQKATREAKVRSSWAIPDKEYEAAVTRLIEGLIDPQMSSGFLTEFLPFQQRISQLGLLNSLSQTVLRLTAPGICDTYQGTELWDFSLVDPDNRRPVDYESRKNLMKGLHRSGLRAMADNMEDGCIKLWITRELLRYRRKFSDLFLSGSYVPILPLGGRAGNVFAFARAMDHKCLIVILPRLMASLPRGERWGNEDWRDTSIPIPDCCRSDVLENVLTGSRFTIDENRRLRASQVLGSFPVAVLSGV